MPALNAAVTAPPRRNNDDGKSFMDRVSFGQVFGIVTALITLKDQWDGYRDRRDEREYNRSRRATGTPAAAASAATAPASPGGPPPYRDDPAEDDIGLETGRLLEGEPPSRPPSPPAPVRRRRTNCCVCCGVRCDIVFKALGIVLALYTLYGAYKLVKWARTPSKTGLEDMPVYSTSLGCVHAPYALEDAQDGLPYTIPIGDDKTLTLNFAGGAVGTVLIAQADDDVTDVHVELDVRTNEEALLGKVSVDAGSGAFRLSTPTSTERDDGCMRFDAVLRVPHTLRNLTLASRAISQVKFAESAFVDLQSLIVRLQSPSALNLVLPHERVTAREVIVDLRGGYIVGALALLDRAEVWTRGEAIANVKVHALAADTTRAPRLGTSQESGRLDVWYLNPERRRIAAEHVSGGGDMYLRYGAAQYSGKVDVQARSWSSTGMQGTGLGKPGEPKPVPWHGDEEGLDTLKVKTSGWAGIYF